MTKLEWAKTGEKEYETGVSNGVLYPRDNAGLYPEGFPWNGLTSVTDSPSGAESNKQYADNEVYVNIKSAEEVGGTIEAFMAPRQFAECDGTREPIPGLQFGQQTRRSFGFSWQSRVGNDIEGVDYGFKIHLVYGADANPSEKQYQTINDSPEPSALSWEYTTIPTASGIQGLRNVSKLTIKSTDLAPAALQALLDVLYGTESTQARLPLPREVYEICLAGEPVEISPEAGLRSWRHHHPDRRWRGVPHRWHHARARPPAGDHRGHPRERAPEGRIQVPGCVRQHLAVRGVSLITQ